MITIRDLETRGAEVMDAPKGIININEFAVSISEAQVAAGILVGCSEAVAEGVSRHLSSNGYDVTTANDFVRSSERHQRYKVGFILMPAMEGAVQHARM